MQINLLFCKPIVNWTRWDRLRRGRRRRRSSLGGDEDQGAGAPAVVPGRRRRARCVPGSAVALLLSWTGVST
jgi:hypothetical protein